MAKYLVIVESPAKVNTIKKFLGANYEVMASNGHVREKRVGVVLIMLELMRNLIVQLLWMLRMLVMVLVQDKFMVILN